MRKIEFRPSRRQAIITTLLYLFGVIGLWAKRTPENLQTEIPFYTAFFSLFFLYLFAAGGLSETEE